MSSAATTPTMNVPTKAVNRASRRIESIVSRQRCGHSEFGAAKAHEVPS
jgi:hypothetical protein